MSEQAFHHPSSASFRNQCLIDRVRHQLSERRFQHTLGVLHVSLVLADAHRVDVECAAQAALLHDQSKEIEDARLRRQLEAFGEPLGPEDEPFPKTWHALHAAAVAKYQLGLRQPELLQAIRLHATADEALTSTGKILFVADFCEPGRGHRIAETLLELARRDLEAGFRQVLEIKCRHVVGKRGRMSPRALRAIDAYLPKTARRDFECVPG